MQNMAAPPSDSNDRGAASGPPANAGNKIEAEAKDGGARKDNDRAAGNADAMKDDKVRDEDGNELPPLGPDAAIHSKLQQELTSEIEKKPESEWGVTSSEGEQAAEVENKVDNANQGESNAPAEPHGSGGLMGKVKHAMHKN